MLSVLFFIAKPNLLFKIMLIVVMLDVIMSSVMISSVVALFNGES